MGLFISKRPTIEPVAERPDRKVFVRNTEIVKSSVHTFRSFEFFTMDVFYLRYKLFVMKTYRDFENLENILRKLYYSSMINIPMMLPKRKLCSCDPFTTDELARLTTNFLQYVVDDLDLFQSIEVKRFIGIGPFTFKPELGRPGKDGHMYKSSGGYLKGFSKRPGDYVPLWSKRYFVFRDTHVSWYDPSDFSKPKGSMNVDPYFRVEVQGRLFLIHNGTRVLKLRVTRTKKALEWERFFLKFYSVSTPSRSIRHNNLSSYPIRDHIDVKFYTISRDYMTAVASALLSAKKEIFIASWKNSPGLLLCRPPLPPVRLDQLLKYKANLGVKIYVLLYKEVELAGQGNNSQQSADHLAALSPNIHIIRHPNKFIGGSTAILWSHHEKLLVVDREVAFVGGIDLAYSRYDDELHSVVDEDGIKYPGHDYRQPGIYKFQPAVDISIAPIDKSFSESNLPNQKVNPSAPILVNSEPARVSIDALSVFNETMSTFAEQAKAQITDQFNILADSAKKQYEKYILNPYLDKAKRDGLLQTHEVRDLYPKTGWHDVHTSVSGLIARDVASHFIQRWNHHRLSSSTHVETCLTDITDDPTFGICARCLQREIPENDAVCRNCNYDLGLPTSSEENTEVDIPPPLSSFSFIVFEAKYSTTTGCIFQGEGPVVVARSSDIEPLESNITQESINKNTFTDDEELNKLTSPIVGDIVLAINDINVQHLSHSQFSRLAKKIRARSPDEPFRLSFRRHFLPDDQTQEGALLEIGMALVEPSPLQPSAPYLDIGGEDEVSIRGFGAQLDNDSPIGTAEQLVEAKRVNSDEVFSPILKVEDAAVLEDLQPQSTTPGELKTIRYALTKESLLALSSFYHEFKNDIPLASCKNLDSSCRVQLLRSVGPWSIGTNVETSILNSWVETISRAKKYIYIENQFFIGNLSGPDVKNPIASSILQRIIQAVKTGEDFKVIIILPQHPSGDIANSIKPRIILNYEYLTINRGRTSLIEQLKMHLPAGVSYTKYINFYCLRNYGVLKDKLYSDQIYVHDKVLIVDDQVAIVGSANINDRSMLGDRDSEVAIKIEDTSQVVISLGKQPHIAGKAIFDFRMKLMSQHVGTSPQRGELVDILRSDIFDREWHDVADHNTHVYDLLDGNASVYKCETLAQYRDAIAKHNTPSIHDTITTDLASGIKGFLVHWPLNFLSKEDMSPPISVRAVVSSQLWV